MSVVPSCPQKFSKEPETFYAQEMLPRVHKVETSKTRRWLERRHMICKWFHHPVPFPLYTATCKREKKTAPYCACLVQEPTPRLLWSLPIKVNKLMKLHSSSNESGRLANDFHMALIKEPPRVIFTTYEGRPQSWLSFAARSFQFFPTKSRRQLIAVRTLHSK